MSRRTPALDLAALRRHALARSLFRPTTLPRAIARLGFVQADPLRAPARAQDLTLRHRVRDYRAGDLERRYPRLAIEEDFFVNYGFLPRALQQLMHPRTARTAWTAARWRQAEAVAAFVRQRGVVHPREVDEAFAHGRTTNWFGGASRASTELLDGMHYRGLLRVARREAGTRLYAPREAPQDDGLGTDPDCALDTLVDTVVGLYAPLPWRSFSMLVMSLRGGVPQWADRRRAAVARARERLPGAEVDGERWVWPEGESPGAPRRSAPEGVRLLAPFDPVVWDRHRFERFWGWAYRFEAYTPAAQRVRGHYALPLLWHEQVIGWGNIGVCDGALTVDLGYVGGRAPRSAAYRAALDDELGRMHRFLGLP